MEIFKTSLITGFINAEQTSSEEYQPNLLVNDFKAEKKVLSHIIRELKACDEFYFSVAFITNSGIAALFNALQEVKEKNIKGKVITSQYLNFTEPRALNRLIKFSNLDVRISTKENLHIKGYIFRKNDKYTIIVGSSNWTQNALSVNQEWNLKVSSMNQGALTYQILNEFNKIFHASSPVTSEWIEKYESIYKEFKKAKVSVKNDDFVLRDIEPNKMQKEALFQLGQLRDKGKNKALIVSATGTGKTYLSAFDARKYKPKRLLFIVHRGNILKSAMKAYRNIFGTSKTLGLFSGNAKETEADFLFATVQTLSKNENLMQFESKCFDYIIIDEVHHSTSNTYQKIINYFQPKFFLGMSATPERMDGCNIFEIFDYNIAYEIRLNKALEEKILSPFHYYGISDLQINGELISDKTKFNQLVCAERVDKVIEASKLYNCDHGKVKGLIFCSRVEEADILSQEFNKRGYKTVSLSGKSNECEREEAMKSLEDEKLDYIFTVDIFNEGVDIPSVNQIIMLRPTQSATIFIQQLGRGLRKTEGKEYLTVIDFIGNYENNYLIPIAIYGENSYNKDTLRKLISGGSANIPGASTINFDYITKQRIFESIDNENMSKKAYLKKDYDLLKYKLGKNPSMMDFIEHGSRDPYTYVEYANSYFSFIRNIEGDLKDKINEIELKNLEFFSKEICNGKRIEEIIILRNLIVNKKIKVQEVVNEMKEKYRFIPSNETMQSAISCLNGKFILQAAFNKFKLTDNIVFQNNDICLSGHMEKMLQNHTFFEFLKDAIEYGYYKFTTSFNKEKYINGFILYEKYSRKDVARILNWNKNEEGTMFGYSIKNNTCPIFVNYKKEDNIDESTKYEDHFINKNQFSWMTRSKVNLNSKEVVAIKGYKSNGLKMLLFIKKSNNEGNDFYYMGDIEPIDFVQKTIKNNDGKELPIVNIKYNMKNPVEDNIYNYIIN